MIRAAALFVVLGATAAEAAIVDVRLGDIAIVYDDERWRAEEGPDKPAAVSLEHVPEAWLFVCIAPECGDDQPVVHARTEDERAGAGLCHVPPRGSQFERYLPGFDADGQDFGGIRVTAIESFDGCRRYTPKMLQACGMNGGVAYTFVSGSHLACRGLEGVPDAMFIELISGVRLMPAGQP